MTHIWNPNYDGNFNGACIDSGGIYVANQICCDMELGGCPTYTYVEATNSCTVEPFDTTLAYTANQYSIDRDDCCRGYKYIEDESLLEACAEPEITIFGEKEIFETISKTCEFHTFERKVYRTMNSGDYVESIFRSLRAKSNRLKCCQSINDFEDNIYACTSQDDEEKAYTYDETSKKCTETTCIR